MGLLITVVATVLLVSAACSGIEAAFFSVSMIKIRELSQKGNYRATLFLAMKRRMGRLVTTIVVINNLANIGGSMLVGSIAAQVMGNEWLGIFSAALTFSVILFSEIIPKTLGERHALPLTLIAVLPMRILVTLFFPLVWIMEILLKPLIKEEQRYTTNESEIKTLISIGSREGAIENSESRMIHQVFKLNDLRAQDIMTPRVMMTSLKKTQRLEDCRDFIAGAQHSRIVVINKTHDDVSGVVMKTELLQGLLDGRGDEPIAAFIHKPMYVPETKRADSLLSLFRESHQHLAIVIDEYGGVAGVVTLEDVLEVLTGEIVDETDTSVDLQAVARTRREPLDETRTGSESR